MKPLIKAGVIALIIYLFFQWEESKRGSGGASAGGSGGAGGGSGAGAKSGCCGGCGGGGESAGVAGKITQQAVSTTDTGDNGFFASPYFDEPTPTAPVSLPSIPAGPAPTPRVVYQVSTRAGG